MLFLRCSVHSQGQSQRGHSRCGCPADVSRWRPQNVKRFEALTEPAGETSPWSKRSDAKQPGHSSVRVVRTYTGPTRGVSEANRCVAAAHRPEMAHMQNLTLYRSVPFAPKVFFSFSRPLLVFFIVFHRISCFVVWIITVLITKFCKSQGFF